MLNRVRAPSANSQVRTTGRWWGRYCAFVGQGMRRITPAAACVWFVLFRNSDDGVVQIGIEQIADITNLDERYVREKLRELVDARLIRVESHGRRNVGVSRYRLLNISTDDAIGADGSGVTKPAIKPSPKEISDGHEFRKS